MLLKNASFVLYSKELKVLKNFSIRITEGKIERIGKLLKKEKGEEVIDCKGKLVMPGLINTHTHASMTLFRGLGEDMELHEWLKKKIWPMESKLNPRDVFKGAMLAIMEMLKTGTTMFADMYFFMDQVAEACKKLGIKGVLSTGVMDFPTPESKNPLKEAERFIKRWKNKHKLITPSIGPHSIYSCGKETLEEVKRIAEENDVLIQIHLSETRREVYEAWKKYKLRPVEYLKSIDFLSERVLAAHSSWLTKQEVKILSEYDVKVSHCPVSNMKLATGGVIPLPEMMKQKVTVSLGTDGAASNNSLNMFETMKFAALLHKHARWDPTITKSKQIVKMATIEGAKALLMKTTGSLEEGKDADIIILNLNTPNWKPLHDVFANLVYSTYPSNVETVIVDGKVVVKDFKLTQFDEERILRWFDGS